MAVNYAPDPERRDSGPDDEPETRYTSPDDARDEQLQRDYDDSCALAQSLTTGARP